MWFENVSGALVEPCTGPSPDFWKRAFESQRVVQNFKIQKFNMWKFIISHRHPRQSTPNPCKIIEKNDRSNAVLGFRTLQNRSNGLNDVLIPKLNTVIVLNDVRSLQEDGTAVWTSFLAFERSCSQLNMRTCSPGKQLSDLNKIINKQFHCDAEINLA